MTKLEKTLHAARRGLRVLFVRSTNQHETMAALTLQFWRRDFVQDGPGIQGDWPTARTSLPNAKGKRVPVLCWEFGDMIALLFHDQSAIVAKVSGKRVTAIPAVFRIASGPRVQGRAVPVVRSQARPQAMISFKHGKNGRNLAMHDIAAEDLRSMPGAETALTDLEADLVLLSKAFSDLPHVHVPDGCPPHPAPDEIWLPWLPQCWVSQDTQHAARQWCQDIADWISLHHPAFSSIEVRISTKKPEDSRLPWLLAAPYQVMVSDRTRSRIFKAASAFCDQTLFTPPARETDLINLDYDTAGQNNHTRTRYLCMARAAERISRHRQLSLDAKFGRPAEI